MKQGCFVYLPYKILGETWPRYQYETCYFMIMMITDSGIGSNCACTPFTISKLQVPLLYTVEGGLLRARAQQ